MRHRVIIVGLGQIGLGYDLELDTAKVYSHARAFSRHPAFELVAGVDRSARQRALLTKHYGCPAYADLSCAVERHAVDVLIIAAPTPVHGELLQQVLAVARPKLVLCEKPLSYDLADAHAMVQSCRERGIALYVNYMRRSDAAVIEIRRRLEAGVIAAPVKGICWYSKGLLNNGSHFFNLLEYWLGPMQRAQLISPGRLWAGTDPEPDVQVSFRNGNVIFIAAQEEAFSHYTIELLASNGRLRYEQGGQYVQWQAAGPGTLKGYQVLDSEVETLATGMSQYQLHVAEQIASVLAGRDDSQLCSGAQALTTLEGIVGIIAQRASIA